MAETLQEALDSWSKNEPKLKSLSDSLNKGEFQDAVPFDITKLHCTHHFRELMEALILRKNQMTKRQAPLQQQIIRQQ